jgi:hypothetical protein
VERIGEAVELCGADGSGGVDGDPPGVVEAVAAAAALTRSTRERDLLLDRADVHVLAG